MNTDSPGQSWYITRERESYEEARNEFEWDLPTDYNPAADLVGKHDSAEPALYYATSGGGRSTCTFGDIDELSDRMANGLESLGIEPGDRVGVIVSQKPATPITHIAAWKLGAISIPLSVLYGADALEYRLRDAGASAVIYDADVRDPVEEVREGYDLDVALEVDGTESDETRSFQELLQDHRPGYRIRRRGPDTPAVIMYTSGSTGPPKGVFHSYAVWLGRAAAASRYFEGDLYDSAVTWSPSDWAWGASLGGLLLASWHFGQPVVGHPRTSFDPDTAFSLLEEYDVTDTFIPPTALRMLMDVSNPTQQYDLSLRTIASVGEPLTPEIVDWVGETFDDVTINEFYGQTELNLVVANNSEWFETRPGSMGKVLPGYDLAILDQETHELLPPGSVGEIAFKPHDNAVFFNEYWNQPDKTAAKTVDGWYVTGDLGERDEDGYIWFKSRADDVIITSGYRVGPGEVEQALLDHDSVEQAGVVGVPDQTRGEVIKAYVKTVSGIAGSDELRSELRTLVRNRLAKHEYPRQIEFVDELPQTTTGKIKRNRLRERSER